MKIADIRIGDRSRRDLGDIEALARSIRAVGLIHPIAVMADGTLIAGARRVAAFVSMGRIDIPHASVDSFDEAVKLMIAERDENTERKPFTPLEALAMAERLEPMEKKAAKERQKDHGKTAPGKRTNTPENFTEVIRANSSDRVASAVGMSRPTLSKIKAVAQAAKEEPEKFAPIAKKMDETGKVDSAFREVSKIKSGANLEEGSRRDPERRWYESLHDLYKFMNSTRDAGGIRKLCELWSADGREKYAAELKRVISEVQKWIDLLQEKAA